MIANSFGLVRKILVRIGSYKFRSSPIEKNEKYNSTSVFEPTSLEVLVDLLQFLLL